MELVGRAALSFIGQQSLEEEFREFFHDELQAEAEREQGPRWER
jgi:hypothetical protein